MRRENRHFQNGEWAPQRIKDSSFRAGSRIIIQKCRKCKSRTESDHLLVACLKKDCDGRMTGELDHYFHEI